MARSLGLTAYRALSRRGDAPGDTPTLPRPEGELIWIHAGEPANLLAVHDLARRLVQGRQDSSVLITLPVDPKQKMPAPPDPQDSRLLQMTAPRDHPGTVGAFLEHWRPSVGLWVWGGLYPNLIISASDMGCPLFLIDADASGFEKRRTRWLPDLTRQVLSCFDLVFARSFEGHKKLAQLGLLPETLTQTTPLLASGKTLDCAEMDEADLSDELKGRPAWFASHVAEAEITTVLGAHRQASRLSHRLLLILQPANAEHVQTAIDLATAQGLNIASWDAGDMPDETTQVLISEDPADRGLFFRVAPVSFLGSTLVQTDSACDPLDAAALGSAVLYGPKVGHFMPSYSRLVTAGAARIVNDADALGTAVSSLISPEHAAAMAHAGWDVISQGAALADRVVDLVHDRLDKRKRAP